MGTRSLVGFDARSGRRRPLQSDKKRKFATIHQIWRSSSSDCQRHRVRRVPERLGNRSQQKRVLRLHCINMNELQIKRILDTDARTKDSFRGVYSRNELPIAAPTASLYVCNTDPNYKPGEHWVTIYIDSDRRGEYFDSFGMLPLFDEFVTFLDNNTKSWTHNKRVVQDVYSSACGFHCIFYAVHRCVGFDVGSIANMYTNDTVFNDAIVEEFVSRM